MILANDTLENTIKYTGVDLNTFFADYVAFIQKYYPNMVNYYQGKTNVLNKDTINTFNKLKKDSDRIIDTLNITIENLDRLDYWNLLEFIDDIYTRNFTLSVLSKWLRSSKYEGFNESSIISDYSTQNFDTPESIARRDRLDADNEWVDIYNKNNVYETDYQAEQGGLYLKIGVKSLANYQLNSVVDNLIGDKVYGADMSVDFRYENDDVFVESHKQTFNQRVLVLAQLKKGDIPETPEVGITPELTLGSTQGITNMPFLQREIGESFGTDDTMLDFAVTDIEFKESKMKIEFKIRSFFDYMTTITIEV